MAHVEAPLDAVEQHIHELLDQAASFVRGADLPGAVARARWAREELSRRATAFPDNEATLERLRALVDLTIAEYEILLRQWQAENLERGAAYRKRERALVGADQPEAPANPEPHVGRRRWRPRRRAGLPPD